MDVNEMFDINEIINSIKNTWYIGSQDNQDMVKQFYLKC
jgi:hypothetical protein